PFGQNSRSVCNNTYFRDNYTRLEPKQAVLHTNPVDSSRLGHNFATSGSRARPRALSTLVPRICSSYQVRREFIRNFKSESRPRNRILLKLLCFQFASEAAAKCELRNRSSSPGSLCLT